MSADDLQDQWRRANDRLTELLAAGLDERDPQVRDLHEVLRRLNEELARCQSDLASD